MAIRSLGWGMRVGIVQYVKGSWETGEKTFFRDNPELLTFEVMGEGFTWDTQDRARDIAAARAAWERSKALILDPAYDFIVLDELNIVLRDYATDRRDRGVLARSAPDQAHLHHGARRETRADRNRRSGDRVRRGEASVPRGLQRAKGGVEC